MFKQLTVTAIVFFLFTTTFVNAATVATETFDLSANGWTANTTSATVVHVANGGNPGGHIQSRRSGGFDIGALVDSDDSADFTGDYAGVDTVSFDAALLAGEVSDLWLRFRRGPAENGWRYPFGGITPVDEGLNWNNYSAPVDSTWSDVSAMGAGWIKEDNSPSFSELMAAVDTAEVRFAAASTDLLVGIDNFSIVPEPNSLVLLLLSAIASTTLRRR